MRDYLDPVGGWGRGFAIVGLLISTFLFSLALLAACIAFVLSLRGNGPPMGKAIGQLVVAGVLAGSSAWMLARVLARHRAANGVTAMPLWFIEAFGLLMALVALVWIARGRPFGMLAGTSVIAAMLLVRLNVKARLTPSESDDSKRFEDTELP